MIRLKGKKGMKKTTAITCVFLDIGGVLLANVWDQYARIPENRNWKWSNTKYVHKNL